jgi:two-component system NtrC family response regulator
LLGESGTGKEALAQALHELGPRAKHPFVAINCGAIPENLLESELFGYERGAFTGAVKQTIGKIENAHHGTLFLDEIADLPHPLQVKLLRFLQDQIVERIGGRQRIQVDVRIVSATNSSLEDRVNEGTFRGDLFYRMNAVTVRIPPLRERSGDALLLANYFLGRFNREFGRNIRGFTEAATAALSSHAWPGNVRELENRMKRAVVMAERRMIDATDLELATTPNTEALPLDLRAARLRAEREVLQLALARANGTLSVAAKLLGISRPTLYGLMEVHGIEIEPGKSADVGADVEETRLDME